MSIPFQMRFIKDISNNSADDILEIKLKSDGTYEWNFADSTLTSRHIVVLTKSYDVYDRLQNLLEMVSLDRQAPPDVQVDAPGYPSVLIPTCDLAKYSRVIVESLHLTMKAWPSRDGCLHSGTHDDMPALVPISSNKRHCTSTRRSERIASQATHQFFDE